MVAPNGPVFARMNRPPQLRQRTFGIFQHPESVLLGSTLLRFFLGLLGDQNRALLMHQCKINYFLLGRVADLRTSEDKLSDERSGEKLLYLGLSPQGAG